MKSQSFQLISITLIISCAFLLFAAQVHGYETKYDDVDIDSILKSERLLSNYVKCLLNEGPCTADAKELKSIINNVTSPSSSMFEIFKKFLNRLTTRRDSIGLFKMYREAKNRIRQSNPLFNR